MGGHLCCVVHWCSVHVNCVAQWCDVLPTMYCVVQWQWPMCLPTSKPFPLQPPVHFLMTVPHIELYHTAHCTTPYCTMNCIIRHPELHSNAHCTVSFSTLNYTVMHCIILQTALHHPTKVFALQGTVHCTFMHWIIQRCYALYCAVMHCNTSWIELYQALYCTIQPTMIYSTKKNYLCYCCAVQLLTKLCRTASATLGLLNRPSRISK